MKNHTITVKLSDNEYKKLKYSIDKENTTISQYIRDCINNIDPRNGRDLQEIATKLCKIYIELTMMKSDENEKIMEGLSRICQILY